MRNATSETDPAWLASGPDLLTGLGTRAEGLTGAEAAARLVEHGRNVVAGGHRRPIVVEFLFKFRNPLVLLLLGAATVAGLSGEQRSFFVILSEKFVQPRKRLNYH